MSRVLVTGGTGYVAGWCMVQLLEQGHQVVATVRSLGRAGSVRAAVEREVGSSAGLTFMPADLLADAGWDAAMEGCEYVLHVASPMSGDSGDSGDSGSLEAVAQEGTLRVLTAAERAGVRRVVVTSSCAAATPSATQLDGTVDESLWTDPDEPGLSAYRRSKVLAERTAWEFSADGGKAELTTVLPGAVFGPALTTSRLGSLRIIAALLDGSATAIPRLGFEIVDVRDVAAVHLRAMTSPDAAGERFIVSGQVVWFADMAEMLRSSLGDHAAKVPTATLTDDDFRAIAHMSPALQRMLPLLGRSLQHSPAKASRLLGWRARPAASTVVDSARCLLAALPS